MKKAAWYWLGLCIYQQWLDAWTHVQCQSGWSREWSRKLLEKSLQAGEAVWLGAPGQENCLQGKVDKLMKNSSGWIFYARYSSKDTAK